MSDNVNHPSHYETGKFECIEVMMETQGKEAVKSFCVCNAFKYLYRHKNKNELEDIKKAVWYLKKFIDLEEGTNDD
nr:MAG TPA: nucelotide kinase [Caudoviricetes sp.]